MAEAPRLGPKGLIDKVEFVRIIAQSLYSLGYPKAAAMLESESGVSVAAPELLLLRSHILAGRWDDCVDALNSIGGLPGDAAFLVLRHVFSELLAAGDEAAAVATLRRRISGLMVGRGEVHQLARELVLSGHGVGRGGVGELRRRLVGDVERLLPPPIRLPERRLEHLVETALAVQRENCFYHNSSDNISLYEDHCCGRDQIPTETVQILTQHENEVWFVQFSHNGKYLASSSSDCTAIIWMVAEEGSMSLMHRLCGHQNPISYVAWSPNDKMVLTCGNAEVLKLWDVESGTCKHTFGNESIIINSCAWYPDSERLVCGSSEPENCIYTWHIEGQILDAWKGVRMPKVSDLSVTPDGEYLISICSDKDIRLFNFHTKSERVISEEYSITSLSVSRDGKFFIINLNSQEIHMWDIEGKWETPLKYAGHKQGKYVIRSCFGGSVCAFIASGSENSQIYIWHQSGRLLEALAGHTATVNCVTWNPSRHQMLASASDDHSIRIWGSSNSELSMVNKQ